MQVSRAGIDALRKRLVVKPLDPDTDGSQDCSRDGLHGWRDRLLLG